MSGEVQFGGRSHCFTSSRKRRSDGGDIKAAERSEAERQESGHGRQAQADSEAGAEKDADRAREASGKSEKNQVAPCTKKVSDYSRLPGRLGGFQPPGNLALCSWLRDADAMLLDVFGKQIQAVKTEGGWDLFEVGHERKRRLLRNVVVPSGLSEKELERFLDDLFHEYATATHPRVRRIG